jgi:hypothetical protein
MQWILIQLLQKLEGLATTSAVGMFTVEKKLNEGGQKHLHFCNQIFSYAVSVTLFP